MKKTLLTPARVLFAVAWIAYGPGRCPAAESPPLVTTKPGLEFIRVAEDRKHFELAGSKAGFKPWGFNYDRDAAGRLLETYWKDDWAKVAADFAQMKQLGANTVRIHLQISRFMDAPDVLNRDSFARLARLIALAESNGLYLDLTGLGCYDKKEVPQWYNDLDESRRWAVQARFWEETAKIGANSPAIFCYDLMNEPVVTEDKQGRDWTPGAFGDRYYVQRLTLDFAGRDPKTIAKFWVDEMASAIRRYDHRHLITVGVIPWALTWPGAKPLFYSREVSSNLDFASVHFYPKSGEIPQALTALAVYKVGKPLVIEEMYPLNCSMTELARFIDGSKTNATGWLGFYWGKPIAEYQREKTEGKGTIADGITLDWLEYFVKKTPDITNSARNFH